MNQIIRRNFEPIFTTPIGKGSIQAESTSTISQRDKSTIWEIEKDMWAHGLWEYVQCQDCWNIDGKYDIFPPHLYQAALLKKTVSQIETILEKNEICCSKCWWNSFPIYWDSYKNDIESRYRFPESFLSTYRDANGMIHGFMDWYIADFDTIYSREFIQYYWDNAQKIKARIEQILQESWEALPKKFLCITALWTDQENGNMFIIYSLLKNFFSYLQATNPYTTWIYESVLWTNTHAIYKACWGVQIDTENLQLGPVENINPNFTSDIFIHPYISESSLKSLTKDLRWFLKTNSYEIEKIVEKRS